MNIEDVIYKFNNDDCLNFMQQLPDNSIDLVLTSPPYDDLRDYENEIIWNFDIFKNIAIELYRIVKDGGVIVWVVGDKTQNGNKSLTSFKQALYFQEIGFNIYDVMIYEKTGVAPPHHGRYSNAYEFMFVISKGKPKTINLLRDKINSCRGTKSFSTSKRRNKDGTLSNCGNTPEIISDYGLRTNIWRYANGKGFATKDEIAYEHPAIFPEKLALDHIKTWTNTGDVVLDIFSGSGTTAKMCEILNRKWIYVDKVKKYCEIAEQRMKALKEKGIELNLFDFKF